MSRRILVADDHPLMRGAITAAVCKVWPDHDIIEVSDAATALARLQDTSFELLTLDLHMQDSSGLGVLMELRKRFPAVPVVVISASEDGRVVASARELGASGFIPKTASLEDMSAALAQVAGGELVFPDIAAESPSDAATRLASLTPAQTRILRFLAEGLLNKQIAYEMDISEATVKAHITAIFRRLGVTNRTQAVLVAKELDLGEGRSGAGL